MTIRIHTVPKNAHLYDLLWRYEQDRQTSFSPNRKDVARELLPEEFIKGKTVLDLCCGRGRLAAGCYDLGATNVVCCDGSYEALLCAEENLGKLGYSPTLVQADMKDISTAFEPESFDIVMMLFALQHQESERKTIHDMATLTKNGGLMAFNHFPRGTTHQITFELREIFLKQTADFCFDFLVDVGYLKAEQKHPFTLEEARDGKIPEVYACLMPDLQNLLQIRGVEEVRKRLHFEDFTCPYIFNTDTDVITNWTKAEGFDVASFRPGWLIAAKGVKFSFR